MVTRRGFLLTAGFVGLGLAAGAGFMAGRKSAPVEYIPIVADTEPRIDIPASDLEKMIKLAEFEGDHAAEGLFKDLRERDFEGDVLGYQINSYGIAAVVKREVDMVINPTDNHLKHIFDTSYGRNYQRGVEEMQAILGTDVDGVIGPDTMEAAREFEKKYGLSEVRFQILQDKLKGVLHYVVSKQGEVQISKNRWITQANLEDYYNVIDELVSTDGRLRKRIPAYVEVLRGIFNHLGLFPQKSMKYVTRKADSEFRYALSMFEKCYGVYEEMADRFVEKLQELVEKHTYLMPKVVEQSVPTEIVETDTFTNYSQLAKTTLDRDEVSRVVALANRDRRYPPRSSNEFSSLTDGFLQFEDPEALLHYGENAITTYSKKSVKPITVSVSERTLGDFRYYHRMLSRLKWEMQHQKWWVAERVLRTFYNLLPHWEFIEEVCEAIELDRDLFLANIVQESLGQWNVTSRWGAVGITQLYRKKIGNIEEPYGFKQAVDMASGVDKMYLDPETMDEEYAELVSKVAEKTKQFDYLFEKMPKTMADFDRLWKKTKQSPELQILLGAIHMKHCEYVGRKRFDAFMTSADRTLFADNSKKEKRIIEREKIAFILDEAHRYKFLGRLDEFMREHAETVNAASTYHAGMTNVLLRSVYGVPGIVETLHHAAHVLTFKEYLPGVINKFYRGDPVDRMYPR